MYVEAYRGMNPDALPSSAEMSVSCQHFTEHVPVVGTKAPA